jgi:hypothetical protein
MGWAVAGVLFAASAYEAAVALERISMGSRPGKEAAGEAVVTIAAFLALLTGSSRVWSARTFPCRGRPHSDFRCSSAVEPSSPKGSGTDGAAGSAGTEDRV